MHTSKFNIGLRAVAAVVIPFVVMSVYLSLSRWPSRWFTTRSDYAAGAVSLVAGSIFIATLPTTREVRGLLLLFYVPGFCSCCFCTALSRRFGTYERRLSCLDVFRSANPLGFGGMEWRNAGAWRATCRLRMKNYRQCRRTKRPAAPTVSKAKAAGSGTGVAKKPTRSGFPGLRKAPTMFWLEMPVQ